MIDDQASKISALARSNGGGDCRGRSHFVPGVRVAFPTHFFKEFVVNFDETGKPVSAINEAPRAEGILAARIGPGRGGLLFPAVDETVRGAVGEASDLILAAMRRQAAPALPELSEPEVLRHYVRLSQQTLGMVGISQPRP